MVERVVVELKEGWKVMCVFKKKWHSHKSHTSCWRNSNPYIILVFENMLETRAELLEGLIYHWQILAQPSAAAAAPQLSWNFPPTLAAPTTSPLPIPHLAPASKLLWSVSLPTLLILTPFSIVCQRSNACHDTDQTKLSLRFAFKHQPKDWQ